MSFSLTPSPYERNQVHSPPSLSEFKPPLYQHSVGAATPSTGRLSPSQEYSGSPLPSPPPPLPPKLKLKQLDRPGTGYAKPRGGHASLAAKDKPVLDNCAFNFPSLERRKTPTREGLSLKLNSPLSIGNQPACTISTPNSKWSSTNSNPASFDRIPKDHINLKLHNKSHSSPSISINPPSGPNSTSSNSDAETPLQDLSARDHKKKQLVLHLPPSGASHHHSHHHNHHHHHHGPHRHLHLGGHRRWRKQSFCQAIWGGVKVYNNILTPAVVWNCFGCDELCYFCRPRIINRYNGALCCSYKCFILANSAWADDMGITAAFVVFILWLYAARNRWF